MGARLAQSRGVTVRIEVDEPVLVLGDAVALQRAALNLVENAVKYTPAGGLVELTVGHEDHSRSSASTPHGAARPAGRVWGCRSRDRSSRRPGGR